MVLLFFYIIFYEIKLIENKIFCKILRLCFFRLKTEMSKNFNFSPQIFERNPNVVKIPSVRFV